MIRYWKLFFLFTAVLSAGCTAAVPARPSVPVATAVPIATLPAVAARTPIPTAVPPPTITPPVDNAPLDPAVCETPDSWGAWCYDGRGGDVFIHPTALVVDGERGRAYVVDGGRVLLLPLEAPAGPTLILAAGNVVDGVRVQEPLDVAVVPGGAVVLDRAGDVYFYDARTDLWSLERYDRPIIDRSSHYYVALATADENRYLLETSYSYGVRYRPDEPQRLWLVDEAHLIDLAVVSESPFVAYVLQRPLTPNDSIPTVVRYVDGFVDETFVPPADFQAARGLDTTAERVIVLDRDGRRLHELAADTGERLAQRDLPVRVSAVAADADGRLLAVGHDTLYFLDEPERQARLVSFAATAGDRPHDPAVWAALPHLMWPINNLPFADRDIRMPGAPRHYRLGIHEGLDFYWGPGRPVRAVADGVVVRAAVDYQPPTGLMLDRQRAAALEAGYTPPAVLDAYRGRQIWIEHEGGLTSRYAHLSMIAGGIVTGTQVTAGQKIGEVGNSGSPASVDGPEADAHLHFELWLDDRFYMGQFLRPAEARDRLRDLFSSPES